MICEEEFAHCGVDGVQTRSVFIASRIVLPVRISPRHGGRVSHTGTSQRLNERLFNNAVLDIEREFEQPCCGAHQPTPCVSPEMSLNLLDLIPIFPPGEWVPVRGSDPWPHRSSVRHSCEYSIQISP
jgi:hypothetical protein